MAPKPKKQRVVIRVDGHALLIDDLTLAEFRTIEERTSVPWTRLNPLRSAAEAAAVLFVLFCRFGATAEEANARADGLNLKQALEHITLEDYEHADDRPSEYEDGVPVIDPKAGPGAPGTTSSS